MTTPAIKLKLSTTLIGLTASDGDEVLIISSSIFLEIFEFGIKIELFDNINSEVFFFIYFFSINVIKSFLIVERLSTNSLNCLSFSIISDSKKSKYVEPYFLSLFVKSIVN